MQSKGLKPSRKREKSQQKQIKQDFPNSFLMIEKVSFSGECQKQNGRDTPQFHESSFRQEQAIDLHPLVLEDPNIQIRSLKQQLHKEIQEHEETKSSLKAVKQLLQNEYNVNREQKLEIIRLKKQLESQKQSYGSLEIQLTQVDNESTVLSATISQKQSEIIELFAIIQSYKERISEMSKKLEQIDPLERSKAQLQWQNGVFKKQSQSLKLMLNKQYLLQNEIKNELNHINSENIKLRTSKAKVDQELSKLLKRQNESSDIILKLRQQKQQLKKQTSKWRVQFAAQAQQKDEQINHLQQHYNQLFKRYQQMTKRIEMYPNMVTKDILDATVKKYEQKIQQHQAKQSKFKEQLDIIEEEIANMQSLLEEKEENEEILLQHIKKLQKDIEDYAINDKWWASILGKDTTQSLQGDLNDQRSKLMIKNQQLIQLLQKNSKTILEGERLKLQLASLKKQNELLSQKQLLMNDQQKQLKQKIGSLYKQNKKLQDKLAKLTKENELLNKKNLWLQEQITQSKLSQKDARQDYEIVSYQLFKIETAKEAKQKTQNERSPIFLSVINENSQELLPSSHHLIRQNSNKDRHKKGSERNVDSIIFQQLAKTIQQRVSFKQQIHKYFENIKQQTTFINVEEIKRQMKRVTLQSSKVKTILVRSGKKQQARQWQSIISTLSKAFQNIIATN